MTEAQPQTAPPPGARSRRSPASCRRPRPRRPTRPSASAGCPTGCVARLRDSGLLRAGAPREVDGLELAPGVALRCAEEVARGDASAGLVRLDRDHEQPARRLPARPRAATSCSAAGAGSPRASGRRAARRGRSTAASSSPAAGRSAAGSRTPTCCSPAASSRSTRRRTRGPCRASSRCPRRSSRSSTPGTRWACAAPAATTRSPTRCSSPRPACSRCSTGRSSTARCTASRSSGSSRCRSRAAALGNARAAIDDLVALAAGKVGQGSTRTLAERAPTQAAVAARRGVAARRAGALLRRGRCRLGGGAGRRAGARRAAQRPAPGGDPRGPDVGRGRAVDVRPGRRHRDLRRLAAPAALPRRPHRHRALPGQRGVPRAPRPRSCSGSPPTPRCCEREVEVVLPYWLDRPDDEALDDRASRPAAPGWARSGSARWRPSTPSRWPPPSACAPGPAAEVGPLAIGVRSPVAIALGGVVGGRPDRQPRSTSRSARRARRSSRAGTTASGRTARARMRETIDCLRAILAGEASDHDGRHVRSHGFRLRRPLPGTRIAVAAFGPAMTRVGRPAGRRGGAQSRPARARRAVRAASTPRPRRRAGPRRAWRCGCPSPSTPAARARAQLASQLAVYLGAAGVRRDVRRARLRGPRRARPGRRPARGAGRARSPRSCSSRSARWGPPDEVAARVSALPRGRRGRRRRRAVHRRGPGRPGRAARAGRRLSTDHDPGSYAP